MTRLAPSVGIVFIPVTQIRFIVLSLAWVSGFLSAKQLRVPDAARNLFAQERIGDLNIALPNAQNFIIDPVNRELQLKIVCVSNVELVFKYGSTPLKNSALTSVLMNGINELMIHTERALFAVKCTELNLPY